MGDGSLSRFDSKGKGRAPQNGDVLALDLHSAEEGSGSQGAFMQMQLVEQQVIPSSAFIVFQLTCLTRTLTFNRARQQLSQ